MGYSASLNPFLNHSIFLLLRSVLTSIISPTLIPPSLLLFYQSFDPEIINPLFPQYQRNQVGNKSISFQKFVIIPKSIFLLYDFMILILYESTNQSDMSFPNKYYNPFFLFVTILLSTEQPQYEDVSSGTNLENHVRNVLFFPAISESNFKFQDVNPNLFLRMSSFAIILFLQDYSSLLLAKTIYLNSAIVVSWISSLFFNQLISDCCLLIFLSFSISLLTYFLTPLNVIFKTFRSASMFTSTLTDPSFSMLISFFQIFFFMKVYNYYASSNSLRYFDWSIVS